MARKSSGPKYFESKGGYYTFDGAGKRVLLAKGPKDDQTVIDQAWTEYHQLQHARLTGRAKDNSNTIHAVLNQYLDWVQKNRSPNTYTSHVKYIGSFVSACGHLKVNQLTLTHVEDWLAEAGKVQWVETSHGQRRCGWNENTRTNAVTVLATAFNWCANKNRRLIAEVPISFDLKSLGLKRIGSRGEQCLITDEQHKLLLDYAGEREHDGFWALLVFLRGTGARPAEVYKATPKDWNEDLSAWVIRANKGSRGRYKLAHRGKDRYIYIPHDLIPLLRRLNAGCKSEDEQIFKNERGEAFTGPALNARFARARERFSEELAGVVPVGYRHAFCTNWLEKGFSIPKLCELLDTSLIQLQNHYGHLRVFRAKLREVLEDFSSEYAHEVSRSGEGDLDALVDDEDLEPVPGRVG